MADTIPGFWRRQFGGSPTRPQVVFDVSFGIVFPILCFAFDPIVFNSSWGGVLSAYRSLAYWFAGLQMSILALWLAQGTRLGGFGGIISGALAGGAAVSILIGLAILPLSLFGLMFGIGLLGFIPFFTGFVLLRNAVRAAAGERSRHPGRQVALAVVLGFCVSAAVPFRGDLHAGLIAEVALAEVASEDAVRAERSLQILQVMGPFVDFDSLVQQYEVERDPARKKRIADAYRRLKGADIESRLARMRD